MADVGFLDRVEIMGEVYEVQTELVDPLEGRLRTVVFHDGQVAAVNEGRLHGAGGGGLDAGAIEGMVLLHHQMVLDGFVERTRGFAERAGASPDRAPATTGEPITAASGAEAQLEMPPIPEDPALADSLEVRRMYSEVRRQIDGEPTTDADTPSGRLERTVAALEWLKSQPRFGRVRLDEQARVHLLGERIKAWQVRGRSPAEADELWQQVDLFRTYVWEINRRGDLLDFDRRLVQWALGALAAGGDLRSLLTPLAWLRGRDAQLDRLLVQRDGVEPSTWREHLERLRRMLPGS